MRAFVCLLLAFFLASSVYSISLKEMYVNEVEPQIRQLAKLFGSKPLSSPWTFECAVCGIAVNEIEGQLMENRTVSDIEGIVKSDLCSVLGAAAASVCDEVVGELPVLVALMEKQYTVDAVCMEVGFCAKPIWEGKDPQPMPHFTINLDLPPQDRFTQICSVPQFQRTAQYLVNTVTAILPDNGYVVNAFGEALGLTMPSEYHGEIVGCAAALGIPWGWATLMNLGYELSDACTSIVAQSTDGTIVHGRNLDFWAGMGFTDSLKNMSFTADWQRGGRTVFSTVSFASFVGVLSGVQSGAFAVTIDTRFYPDGIGELLYEIVAAIEERNASLVTFLSREVVQNEHNYASAVSALSSVELIADVYYIVSGVAQNEGVVISRSRMNASNIWSLAVPTTWYVLETNYDHWKPAPWFDDRRDPGIKAMNALGQSNVNTNSIFEIMSTKPVLNLQTTYSVIFVPKNGSMTAYSRWCKFPCVQ